jgi:hypothetical protein
MAGPLLYANPWATKSPRPFHAPVRRFTQEAKPGELPGSQRGVQTPWRVYALNAGRDLIVGDALLLTSFCIYKQLAAVVLSPSFPGWLAPLTFDATRFTELIGFIITVTGTWVACAMLNSDYSNPAASAEQLPEFP